MEQFWSPYSYMGNGYNPINGRDYNGLDVCIDVDENSTVTDVVFSNPDGYDVTIIDHNGNATVHSGAELREPNYFNSQDLIGQRYVGNIFNGTEAQDYLIGYQKAFPVFGDLLQSNSRQKWDLKTQAGRNFYDVGLYSGKLMTTRDAGNAHWIVANRLKGYPLWLLKAGGDYAEWTQTGIWKEEAPSRAMQLWGNKLYQNVSGNN